jgi:HPt (histidine-containing phosphotransfer) domain-containing protein
MQALLSLEEALSADTVARMAAIFAAEWARQKALVLGGEPEPRPGARRQAAHDLVTNAGSLGFNELSTAARRLEQAILNRDEISLESIAAPIEGLAAAALAELTSRYGTLT